MAGPLTFPELRANFTPVPDVLFEVLLTQGVSREELLVTLFLIRKNYEFEKEMTLVPFEVILTGTDLDAAAASRGLAAALTRGTVLHFHSDSGPSSSSFYLLSTEENIRVMGPIRPGQLEPAVPVPPPAPPATRPATSPSPAATGLQQPPAAPAAARAGLGPLVLSRIAEAVGRDLTKDERSRLEELDATDERLLQAVENLQSRQVEIYSSDLILYEHESIRSSERRSTDDYRRRAEIDNAKTRQKSCKRCNGLGYLFVGVNTVEECACRKAR